jgi:hypothetical protein
MKTFRIRDLILVTVIVAVICAWMRDHYNLRFEALKQYQAGQLIWHDRNKIVDLRDFSTATCPKHKIQMDSVICYSKVEGLSAYCTPEQALWIRSTPNDNSRMVIEFCCPLCRAEEISAVLNE